MRRLIFRKKVNKSLLEQGFVIPVEYHETLARHLSGGALEHGEKRQIKIFFAGRLHDVRLQSNKFDRKKFPTHTEQWRVLYNRKNSLAEAFRRTFAPNSEAYFDFFATDVADVFYVEPKFDCNQPRISLAEAFRRMFSPNADFNANQSRNSFIEAFRRVFAPNSEAYFDFCATDIKDVFYAKACTDFSNNQWSINQCMNFKIRLSIKLCTSFLLTLAIMTAVLKSARRLSSPTPSPIKTPSKPPRTGA